MKEIPSSDRLAAYFTQAATKSTPDLAHYPA
jgi:hypothetical protein